MLQVDRLYAERLDVTRQLAQPGLDEDTRTDLQEQLAEINDEIAAYAAQM